MESLKYPTGKAYRRFKRILVGVAIFLAVSDVYFLFDQLFFDEWALDTISKVVLYSSPKYLVFIWLFGFLSAHFFFPRPRTDIHVSRAWSITGTVSISVFLVCIGFYASQGKTCANLDYPNFQSVSVFTEIFMETTCRDAITNRRVECDALDCEMVAGKLQLRPKEGNMQKVGLLALNDPHAPAYKIKYDLTLEMKFLLILMGLLAGYFLWPQREG